MQYCMYILNPTKYRIICREDTTLYQCLTAASMNDTVILTLILIADVYMIKESSSAVVDS